jgi:CubicO group peptidase (beta-lactamase class C family)
VTLVATPRDARSHPVAGKQVHVTSSAPAVVEVAAGGLAARASGRALLTARVDGVTATLGLAVYDTTGRGLPEIDQTVARFLGKHGIPGATVAITHQGRLVHARGYGLADTLARIATLPGSRFRVASVSKSITAVAMLRLVEQGTVSLDDRVFVDWLPDLLPAGPLADPRILEITVRHLLQHVGGWNHPPNDPMFIPQAISAELGVPGPPLPEDIIRYTVRRVLQAAPGTARAYSNVGYSTLGRVIERASGQGYFAHLATVLPASATSFAQARSLPGDRLPDEVTYYSGGAEQAPVGSVFPGVPGPVPIAYGGFHVEALDATGGWVASAPDLARFLLTVDGRPEVADVISPASRTMLGTDSGVPGNLANYGMGWYRIGQVMYHTGRLPGQSSLVVIDDARELTWTFLINWSDPAVAFANEFANVLTAAITARTSWPGVDYFGQF